METLTQHDPELAGRQSILPPPRLPQSQKHSANTFVRCPCSGLTLFIILILFFGRVSSTFSSTREYFPLLLSDGDTALTRIKITSIVAGHPPNITELTLYDWVAGSTFISGIQCKRHFVSREGFYDFTAHVDAIYSALVGNECRTYAIGSLDPGLPEKLGQHDPYKAYVVEMQPGTIYSYHYTSTFDYVNTIVVTDDVFEMLGYETVTTCFGTYPNCLKMKCTSNSTSTSNGYSHTSSGTTMFWQALNIGVVKQYTESVGIQVTDERVSSYSITPPYVPAPTIQMKVGFDTSVVVVSWPIAYSSVVLQFRKSLAPTEVWSTVTNASVFSVGGEFVVTNSLDAGAGFFRLKSQ